MKANRSDELTNYLVVWNMGYQDIFQFDGNIGPLECILMALLALFNEGAPGHFFHLMEALTMRLKNAKRLLRWPSRMHIYVFVESHTFFNKMEQFDSMGVPGHFSIRWSNLIAWWVSGHFSI